MNSTIHKETQMTIALHQTRDKLYHHANGFMYLIILQMIGYLISFQAMSGGFGTSYFHFSLRGINPLPLHFLTILWIVMQGWHFAGNKSQEYYLVSNNFTAYFSDIAVLEIYALVGGFTILLSGSVLQLLAVLFFDSPIMHPAFFQVGFLQQASLFISASLYLLIFGAGAYTVGILRTRYESRFFLGVFLAVVLLIGVSVVAARVRGYAYTLDLVNVAGFYVEDARFGIWLVKVVATIAALYGISWLGIRNLEVNRS